MLVYYRLNGFRYDFTIAGIASEFRMVQVDPVAPSANAGADVHGVVGR